MEMLSIYILHIVSWENKQNIMVTQIDDSYIWMKVCSCFAVKTTGSFILTLALDIYLFCVEA